MLNKILVLKYRKIIKILRINMKVTHDIKNLTIPISYMRNDNFLYQPSDLINT